MSFGGLGKALSKSVRSVKREVNKTILMVPMYEQKALDATSNESWGPHGSLMAELASATRNHTHFQLIMGVLYKRLQDSGKAWRHVYKALTLMEYLVANGAERCIDDLRQHTYIIRRLTTFQYVEPGGIDQGLNVRTKAESLLALLKDTEKIRSVREKAETTKEKLRGSQGSDRSSYREDKLSPSDRTHSPEAGRYGDERRGEEHEDYGERGGGKERYSEEKYDRYGDVKSGGRREVEEYRGERAGDHKGGRDGYTDGPYRTKGEERLADEYGGPYRESRAAGGSNRTAVESGAGSTSSGVASTSDSRYPEEGYSSSTRGGVGGENGKSSSGSASKPSGGGRQKDREEGEDFDPRGAPPPPAAASVPTLTPPRLAPKVVTAPLAAPPVAYHVAPPVAPLIAPPVAPSLTRPVATPASYSPPHQPPPPPYAYSGPASAPAYAYAPPVTFSSTFTPFEPVGVVTTAFHPFPSAEPTFMAHTAQTSSPFGAEPAFSSVPAPTAQWTSFQTSISPTPAPATVAVPAPIPAPVPIAVAVAALLPASPPPPPAPAPARKADHMTLPPPSPSSALKDLPPLLPSQPPTFAPPLPSRGGNSNSNSKSQSQSQSVESKSGMWADALSLGLVDLNIEKPMDNPLMSLGIDMPTHLKKAHGAELRGDLVRSKEMKEPVAMGRAMGAGTGLGRAGTQGMAPPPQPGMGFGMGRPQGYGQYPAPRGMGMGTGAGAGAGMGYPGAPPPQGAPMGYTTYQYGENR